MTTAIYAEGHGRMACWSLQVGRRRQRDGGSQEDDEESWAAGRVTGGDKPDVGEGEAGVRVRQTGEEIKGGGSAT